jgi:HTH-type transcriptional regulator / antitoxin HigA
MTKLIAQTFKTMTKINNELEYKVFSERMEELLQVVDNDTTATDKNLVELGIISALVADYEEEHYPITAPTLVDVIKLRMYEMKLNQIKLSEMLGISTSRVSEYLTGKSEPTLKVAREISKKLNIDAHIILGV